MAAGQASWAAAAQASHVALPASPVALPAAIAPAAPAAPSIPVPAMPSASAPLPSPAVDACPKELTVRQAVVADIPGWTSVNQQESYPFARIALYSGPPADEKRIVPTFEYRNATGLHDGWRLQKQPAGTWMQCQYGNTTAVVIRKLDDANDFCTADYDPHFSTLVVKHWACMPGRPPAPAPASRKEAAKGKPESGTHWVHGK